MAGKHVLKLAPRRSYFYDPVSGLFLRYPDRMIGELPFDADIRNIKRAVAFGSLIDVNGTVLAGKQDGNVQAAVEQKAAEPEIEQEIEQKKEEEVKPVDDEAVCTEEFAPKADEVKQEEDVKPHDVKKKKR